MGEGPYADHLIRLTRRVTALFLATAVVLSVLVWAAVPATAAIENQTETAKLIAALDDGADDNIGRSVAISGDLAVVGAYLDDVGSNADQGSAYVFVRSGTTWTKEAKLTASDGAADDLFGASVALDGDRALLGAPQGDVGANSNQGAAYVFVRSGTTWTQEQKLTASDGAAGDQLGISVAIDGDRAVVGAPGDDVGANVDQGSAYVFVRSGTTWTQEQKLTASDGAGFDQFGWSVAIDGALAVVGVPIDSVGGNGGQGSAYAFVRSGTTWTQEQKLTAADGDNGDFLGWSVALDGDRAVIGAPFDNVGTNNDQGSAYVWVRSGTTWTQEQKLNAADGAGGDQFGRSVALDGGRALAGAIGDDSFRGSAYVFVRSATTWTQEQKLNATGGAVSDDIGYSVALDGERALVGAPGDDVGAFTDQGSAYVFVRSGTTWTQEAKLAPTDGAAFDNLGYSVAIDGDLALVGARFDDVGTNNNQGSVYVFVRSGTTWTQEARLTAADGAAFDNLGHSVALDGDRALVGADLDDVGASDDQGSAYVFVRSGTTWTQETKLVAADGAASDEFGYSVALEGERAVVGAPGDNSDQGSAYVFVRSGTTWTEETRLTASDGAGFDQFGWSVAIDGDRALVGALGDDSFKGSAYVFVRSGTTWTQEAKLTASDGNSGDFFGYSVALDGDLALVGAPEDDAGANGQQGSAYVFVRSGTTWTQEQKLTAADGAASDFFGYSVALDGDLALVGARGDDSLKGSAYVFVRSGTTWTDETRLTATDGAASDIFGSSVALDGDRAVVGAPGDDVETRTDQGSAYVFELRILTVSKSGNGAGSVAGSRIDCGTDCIGTYDDGTDVTLSATPDVNSDFAGWSGACINATGDCVVDMGASKSVTATFVLETRDLTVSKNGNGSGTVSGSQIDCGSDCAGTYDHGTQVTLSAAEAVNSDFAGWSGACLNTTGDCVVTMDAAKSVTATFVLETRDLNVSKSGNGSGTVSGSQVDCGSDCTGTYDHGTSVTLSATPDVNSDFAGWSGACLNTTGDCVVTMDAAKSVTATFVLEHRVLTVDAIGPGTITSAGIDCGLDCSESFAHGTLVTLTADADAGANFTGWSGDCSGDSDTCTFTVDSARNVTATFSDDGPGCDDGVDNDGDGLLDEDDPGCMSPTDEDESNGPVTGACAAAPKGVNVLVGTLGDDLLRGTPDRDVICGLAGNDTIRGVGGNDLIVGGGGDDRLRGGLGDDWIYGSKGDDLLRGSRGHDKLRGNAGADRIQGGSGNDALLGRVGEDSLWGWTGDDLLDGGEDADLCLGGPGDNSLFACETSRRLE